MSNGQDPVTWSPDWIPPHTVGVGSTLGQVGKALDHGADKHETAEHEQASSGCGLRTVLDGVLCNEGATVILEPRVCSTEIRFDEDKGDSTSPDHQVAEDLPFQKNGPADDLKKEREDYLDYVKNECPENHVNFGEKPLDDAGFRKLDGFSSRELSHKPELEIRPHEQGKSRIDDLSDFQNITEMQAAFSTGEPSGLVQEHTNSYHTVSGSTAKDNQSPSLGVLPESNDSHYETLLPRPPPLVAVTKKADHCSNESQRLQGDFEMRLQKVIPGTFYQPSAAPMPLLPRPALNNSNAQKDDANLKQIDKSGSVTGKTEKSVIERNNAAHYRVFPAKKRPGAPPDEVKEHGSVMVDMTSNELDPNATLMSELNGTLRQQTTDKRSRSSSSPSKSTKRSSSTRKSDHGPKTNKKKTKNTMAVKSTNKTRGALAVERRNARGTNWRVPSTASTTPNTRGTAKATLVSQQGASLFGMAALEAISLQDMDEDQFNTIVTEMMRRLQEVELRLLRMENQNRRFRQRLADLEDEEHIRAPNHSIQQASLLSSNYNMSATADTHDDSNDDSYDHLSDDVFF